MALKPDEKFEMTQDEIERLTEAFKKEEFRKLFAEYAEEISNPENRKKYEEDIAELEKERGVDVKFVHPHPGYVLRTCVDDARKAFINIAQNDAIEKASFDRTSNSGARGMHWNIPHSFAPPREDRDKSGERCAVFDVVFHPDTIRMALSNAAFRRAIDSTALDGVEAQFGVRLDRGNVKTMKKLKFKGKPTATVIRKRKESCAPPRSKTGGAADDDSDPLARLPYPYDDQSQHQRKQPPSSVTIAKSSSDAVQSAAVAADRAYTVPKYTIVNQYHADISDFACNLAEASAAGFSNRPKALVVEVSLPLLSSASGITLDVLERKLSLKSDMPARYKLDLPLPYAVDEAAGTAKFDKRRKCLAVTLPLAPVKPPVAQPLDPEADGGSKADGGGDDVCRVVNGTTPSAPLGAVVTAATGSGPVLMDAGDGHLSSNDQQPDLGNSSDGAGPTGAAVTEGDKVVAGHKRSQPDQCLQQCDKPTSTDAAPAFQNGCDARSVTPKQYDGEGSDSAAADTAQLPERAEGTRDRSIAAASSATSSSTCTKSIMYIVPPFTYDQEDSTVTFVVGVPNVKRDSFRVVFGAGKPAAALCATGAPSLGSTAAVGSCGNGSDCSSNGSGSSIGSGSSFTLTCRSVGSGQFPMHYSLAALFPAGCLLEHDRVDVDVSASNAVVVFHKASSSHGSWQQFWIGSSPQEAEAGTAEVKQFITHKSLQAELSELDRRFQEARQADSAAATTKATTLSLDVKSLHDECLSINIREVDVTGADVAATGCAGAVVDVDEGDVTTLPSPEIIYTKEPPKDLQGILKKHASTSSCQTVSESSDGPDDGTSGHSASEHGRTRSGSGGSSEGVDDSPESSDDANAAALKQRKKAVTFNDHVDETAYQPTAAVTMLHQTLKNKRKRQKKKEDRKHHATAVAEGRRRRRNSSSGSITTDEEDAVAAGLLASTSGGSGSSSRMTVAGSRKSQRAAAAAVAATSTSCNGSQLNDQAESTSSDIDPLAADQDAGDMKINGSTPATDTAPLANGVIEHHAAGDAPLAPAKLPGEVVPADRGTPRGPLEQNSSAGERPCNEFEHQPSPDAGGASSGKCEPGRLDSDDDADTAAPTSRSAEHAGRSSGSIHSPLNEHATKCAFDFRNSIIYELDE